MITLRPSEARGRGKLDWLDSYFSFSFSHYYDPAHINFSNLRVINEDYIAPGKGFATHGHQDMEIITYVLEGELKHQDSIGNGSIIRPGDVQRMSAGTGILHSEFNPSPDQPVHLLQIWITPNRLGVEPSYEQKFFSTEDKQGKLRLVASPDGRDGSVTIHQDAHIYASVLEQGKTVSYSLSNRRAWLQIIRGNLTLNGKTLKTGDGAGINEEQAITCTGQGEATEFLLFDLP
ncbi:pirin family protein [Synechocystis sp. PCC 7339]|uniref:pirin family protein n=1 Tax=unclassified Synechocystis TaxID=2640012 RepID=UPI001BAEF7E4|nr:MULTISPECIES: pirin family protein [unclassified Synechocystis]QUS61782.1 pirin family protein [Synechocystis sp. PCC 7338]UAJ73979.1 pirin family protein [Synechocystis sp. PCC 7339]